MTGLAPDRDDVEQVELPPDLASAGAARRFAVEVLERWGAPGSTIDDAMLIVSELVTNSVTHAESPCRLRLWRDGARIRGSVHDTSSETPVVHPMDPTRVGGNGMHVVTAIADDIHVEIDPSGKTVSFLLR